MQLLYLPELTRGYLRHLIVAKEMLTATLLSIHNLHVLIQVTHDLRQAIVAGTLGDYVEFFNKSRNEKEENLE